MEINGYCDDKFSSVLGAFEDNFEKFSKLTKIDLDKLKMVYFQYQAF